MKKLVTFAMILSLGMFCAVGCNKAEKKAEKKDKPAAAAPAAGEKDKEPAKEAAPAAEKEKAPEATPPAPEKK
jgi:hypothetical protein